MNIPPFTQVIRYNTYILVNIFYFLHIVIIYHIKSNFSNFMHINKITNSPNTQNNLYNLTMASFNSETSL